MTNTDIISPQYILSLLRAIRAESGPGGVSVNLTFTLRALDYAAPDFVGSDLVVSLRDRGLIMHGVGPGWTTTASADRMLDAIDAKGAEMLAEFEECGYTFSHTREWCGHPYCRES